MVVTDRRVQEGGAADQDPWGGEKPWTWPRPAARPNLEPKSGTTPHSGGHDISGRRALTTASGVEPVPPGARARRPTMQTGPGAGSGTHQGGSPHCADLLAHAPTSGGFQMADRPPAHKCANRTTDSLARNALVEQRQ